MSLFALFTLGIGLGQSARFFPFLSLLLLGALTALFVLVGPVTVAPARRAARACALVLCSLSGFALSSQSPSQPFPPELPGGIVEIEGILSSEASAVGRDGVLFSQQVRVSSATTPDGKGIEIREVRILSDEALPEGRAYRFRARAPRDAYFLNPGSMPRAPSLHVIEAAEAGVPPTGPAGGLLSLFSRWRAELNAELRGRFSEETAPFLLSQITGERRFMTKELKDAFNVTGLAHLLSISGTHFGLLFVVLFRSVRFLIRRLPHRLLLRLTLYATPTQLGALLSFPLMVCYLGISDASIPAVRSFIMISFFLLGLVLQRRGFWLNTVLIAAVIIVAPDPPAVLDLSFQLSFVAVLCIGAALERLRSGQAGDEAPGAGRAGEPVPESSVKAPRDKASIVARVLRGGRGALVSSVAISLAATVGTAPLVAYHFHYFSVISPLTNLIVTPFVGLVLLPVALLSSFAFLFTGHFPLTALIEGLADLAVTAVLHLGRFGFADVRVPGFPPAILVTFYAGLLAYVAIAAAGPARFGPSAVKRLSQATVAVAFAPLIVYGAVASFRSEGLTVTYLDVGQGDAAVIELPDGRTLVVDTGRQGVQVGEYLRYRGKRRIDALVLSHGQSDHVGGVRYLAKNFRILEIWDNGSLRYDETLSGPWERRSLTRGDVLEAAGCRVTAFHPHRAFYPALTRGGQVNNDSLVLKLSGKAKTFLFAGDIEHEAQEDLLHLGTALRSSVLKVPHHGSRSALHDGFLKAVMPEVAVVSAGRSNSYGFPHPEVVSALAGARVCRTDRDGAVGVREGPGGNLSVKVWREHQIAEARTLAEEAVNLGRLFRVWL